MAEYDDTNKGASFTPFPQQQFILQGHLNIDGEKVNIVNIQNETKDGKQIIEVYQKVGVLFTNVNPKDGAPNWTGPFLDSKRLAGWAKMDKDGRPYMSFNITEKQNTLPNDKIPF
jgi:ribosomal protein S4